MDFQGFWQIEMHKNHNNKNTKIISNIHMIIERKKHIYKVLKE